MKTKIIVVWICALYFSILFYSYLGHVIFGTLGVLRPGDTSNGMIEVAKVNDLIQSLASPLQRLTWFVGFGAIMLLSIAFWLTAGAVRERNSARER